MGTANTSPAIFYWKHGENEIDIDCSSSREIQLAICE